MYVIEYYSRIGPYHWEEIESFHEADEAEEAFKTFVRLYIGTSFRLSLKENLAYSSGINGGTRYSE